MTDEDRAKQIAAEFYFCWACLRVQQQAGGKLSPQETVEAVDRECASATSV